MKKSKVLAAAMASVALTGTLGSCSFDPENDREPDVYGPPASFEEPADSVSSTEYLPSVNVEPNVYGPPEVMGSSSQN